MKRNPESGSSSACDTGRAVLRHEEVAAHAEAIWRQRGCPQGCDEEIWLVAERQLVVRSEQQLLVNIDDAPMDGRGRLPPAVSRVMTSI